MAFAKMKHAFALLAGFIVLGAQHVAADDYPNRPIRLIVAFPAAGPADIAARIIAEQLSTQLAQRVIVDNRAGAGGIIGTQLGATAGADGYTLLLTGNNVAITQAMATTPPGFDAVESFAHIARIAVLPSGLFVSADSGHSTLNALLTNVREKPDQLTYGTGGVGSPSHLAMELLKRRGQLEIRHIAYKGTAPALTDLMGRQIDMLFTSIAGPMQQVKAGRLRLLAVSSPERLPQLPDVPTLNETYSGYEFETWLGISAPRNVPADNAKKLANEIEKALIDPALVRRMDDAGLTPKYLASDPMSTKVREELVQFGRVIREANIKPE